MLRRILGCGDREGSGRVVDDLIAAVKGRFDRQARRLFVALDGE
jgi:hypothetical protein